MPRSMSTFAIRGREALRARVPRQAKYYPEAKKRQAMGVHVSRSQPGVPREARAMWGGCSMGGGFLQGWAGDGLSMQMDVKHPHK